MSPRVKINDIINIIRFQSYNSTSYLDKERGELFLISKEQLIAAQEDGGLEDYPEWERAQIKLAREILTDKKCKRYILWTILISRPGLLKLKFCPQNMAVKDSSGLILEITVTDNSQYSPFCRLRSSRCRPCCTYFWPERPRPCSF